MQAQNEHTDNYVSDQADAIRKRILISMGGEHGAQARVSRETGLGRGHLSQLLTGRRGLHYRHIRLLATALNVNLDWLLTGEGHPDDVDTVAPAPIPGVRSRPPPPAPPGTGDLLVRDAAPRDVGEVELLSHVRALNPERQRALLRLARELRVAQDREEAQATPGSPARHPAREAAE